MQNSPARFFRENSLPNDYIFTRQDRPQNHDQTSLDHLSDFSQNLSFFFVANYCARYIPSIYNQIVKKHPTDLQNLIQGAMCVAAIRFLTWPLDVRITLHGEDVFTKRGNIKVRT